MIAFSAIVGDCTDVVGTRYGGYRALTSAGHRRTTWLLSNGGVGRGVDCGGHLGNEC